MGESNLFFPGGERKEGRQVARAFFPSFSRLNGNLSGFLFLFRKQVLFSLFPPFFKKKKLFGPKAPFMFYPSFPLLSLRKNARRLYLIQYFLNYSLVDFFLKTLLVEIQI